MDELKIEYVPIDSIEPYAKNAKLHPAEQIEQIKKSIQDYGFRDPVGVWRGQIVEGHGRILAAKELGMTEVPVIRLDDMTDEQRREYALVHNQTTMNSGFDFAVLDVELAELPDLDMDFYGIDVPDLLHDEYVEDFFDRFYLLAFYPTFSFSQIISMGFATCLLEIIIGVCDTPFLYIAKHLKHGDEK